MTEKTVIKYHATVFYHLVDTNSEEEVFTEDDASAQTKLTERLEPLSDICRMHGGTRDFARQFNHDKVQNGRLHSTFLVGPALVTNTALTVNGQGSYSSSVNPSETSRETTVLYRESDSLEVNALLESFRVFYQRQYENIETLSPYIQGIKRVSPSEDQGASGA